MKKVLLTLLMAVVFLPMAMGQTKADRIFVTENATECGAFTWIDGNTYATDTTVMYTSGDTVYVLNLTMLPAVVDTTAMVEVTGECVYTNHGKTWVEEGTFYDTLRTVQNCDSVIKINITLTRVDVTDTLTVAACDSYTSSWGETYTTSGQYTQTESVGICEHTHMLDLTVNYGLTDTALVQLNEVEAGCSYTWQGTTYTDTMAHYKTLYTVNGHCDSLAGIRVVSFSGTEYDTANVVSCGNVSYTWYGRTFNAAAQADTTIVVDGCTTHHHLNLTYGDAYDTIVRSSCAQYVYTYDSRTGAPGQRESATFTESGIYNEDMDGLELVSRHWSTGCITHHTLNLTIVQPQQRERDFGLDTAACDSYTFTVGRTSVTFDTDTVYTLTHYAHGTNGNTNICYDSIGTLNLTIKHSTINDTVVVACDTFYWDFNDTYYTSSIVAQLRDSILNEEGCPMIGKLNLTINYTPEVTIEGEWNLQPGESTTLTAVTPMSNVRYAWYRGTSTTPVSTTNTLALNNVNENIDIHLVSTSQQGCVANNWLTVTSNVGIDDVDALSVRLYPNPTSRVLNVESADMIATVAVYNAIGQQVMLRNGDSNAMQLDLGNLANGQYSIRIISVNGDESTRKFVVSK